MDEQTERKRNRRLSLGVVLLRLEKVTAELRKDKLTVDKARQLSRISLQLAAIGNDMLSRAE